MGVHNNKIAKRIKVALINRGLTVQAMADSIKHPRPTVSVAIHTDRFPKVRAKILKFLKLA